MGARARQFVKRQLTNADVVDMVTPSRVVETLPLPTGVTQWVSYAFAYDAANQKWYQGMGVLNGTTTTNITSQVWVYDIVTKTWTQLASQMQRSSLYSMDAIIDGKWYVFGGTDTAQGEMTAYYVYTIAANTWASCAAPPANTAGGYNSTADTVNKKVVITAKQNASWTYIYTPSTNSWVGGVDNPRNQQGYIAFDPAVGKVQFQYTGTGSTQIYFYDVPANTWTTITATSTNAAAAMGSGSNGGLTSQVAFPVNGNPSTWGVLGGYTDGAGMPRLEVFDIDLNRYVMYGISFLGSDATKWVSNLGNRTYRHIGHGLHYAGTGSVNNPPRTIQLHHHKINITLLPGDVLDVDMLAPSGMRLKRASDGVVVAEPATRVSRFTYTNPGQYNLEIDRVGAVNTVTTYQRASV